jgi:hypothetical protein
MTIHDQIKAEQDHIRALSSMIGTGEPDLPYEPREDVTGKFIRHYSYDRFDELYIEVYENGVVLGDCFKRRYEWYFNSRKQEAFDRVKLIKQRNGGIDRMLG